MPISMRISAQKDEACRKRPAGASLQWRRAAADIDRYEAGEEISLSGHNHIGAAAHRGDRRYQASECRDDSRLLFAVCKGGEDMASG